MPEPVIALMAFILGIWMWNRYFTPKIEYAQGTERLALVKIDRDLRLADAMAGDPEWMRKFTGVRSRDEVGTEALRALEKLEAWQAMGPDSVHVYHVVRAVLRQDPLLATLAATDTTPPAADGSVKEEAPSWWRARIFEARERKGEVLLSWKPEYERSLKDLRFRSLALSGALALLLAAGAFCLPATLRILEHGLRAKPKGYAAAWTPALGLTVFMVATLAWIGYVGTLDLGIEKITSMPPLMGLLLDTAARFLPVLIALGFLFKRPTHAFRVLGLDRWPDLRPVLGMFPLLLLADWLLRSWIGNPGENEPAGGLSVMDAGIIGLMFVVISACLIAPLTEEILYRGVLFRSLSGRMGVVAAGLVSAIVFSAIHFYDLQGFISVAIFGFACALLYAGSGSLSTVIALHVLYNFSIKMPAWLFYHAGLDR